MSSNMDILVLDRNFQTIHVLDEIKSLIWTDRYSEYGDFEIYTPVSKDLVAVLKEDYYLWNKQSEHMMIIDTITITTDVELGHVIKITGLSLESILTRRIIWSMVQLTGNLQTQLRDKVFNPNVINPTDSRRRISNFQFKMSTDPLVTSCTIDQQFTGKTIYELLQEVLPSRKIGFRITLNENNIFVFELYAGTDRSYTNKANLPYVVFSPEFENLVDSSYCSSFREWKNSALVAGEDPNLRNGETGTRRTYEVSGSYSGLDRREMFVDARDIQSEDENNQKIPDKDYDALLKARGESKLSEHEKETVFDGDVDTIDMFVYKRDFFMGDIVQVKNEYDIGFRSRIVEMVFNWSTQGYTVIPTFDVEEEEA